MATTEVRNDDATSKAKVKRADFGLEVVVIPVSDVDRSKQFYRTNGVEA